MSDTNLAQHFARLLKVYREYNIVSPAQVLDIDESRVSTRRAGSEPQKAVMRAEGTSNSIDVDWAKNDAHVMLIPVVSADGRAWTPVAIFLGVRQQYRTLANRNMKMPASFLPAGTFVSYRASSSMEKKFSTTGSFALYKKRRNFVSSMGTLHLPLMDSLVTPLPRHCRHARKTGSLLWPYLPALVIARKHCTTLFSCRSKLSSVIC